MEQCVCTRCGGSGRIDCKNCEGSGKLGACPHCFGNQAKIRYEEIRDKGKSDCSECLGSGFEKCKDCQRRGFTYCSRCEGFGTISY